MLMADKNAVIYGAAGSMGSAVALPDAPLPPFRPWQPRSWPPAVSPEVAQVDALDQHAREAHADEVIATSGSFDVSFNAISSAAVQGTPLVDLTLDDFMAPIIQAARTHFVTATAAARRMAAQRSGVIVMLSSSAAQESRHRMGGFNLA